jgi:hypothetical protein
MDGLTFTDHLIGHLAWPLVVAGLVVFLSLRHRAALDTVLHRVRKARAGPFEAELDEAKEEAERANLPAEPAALSTGDDEERRRQLRFADPEEWLSFFMGLADRDPFGAVHGSFHFMNGYLYEAANRLNPEPVQIADEPSGWGRAASVGLLTPEHEKVRDRLADAVRSATEARRMG